jgi:glucosamine--fructose-6-phosphate aminotransferase (isomerizing)
MSLTYNETKDQYNSLSQTYEYLESQKSGLKHFWENKQPKSITFIGSGSSYYIAQSLEMIAKVKMGIPASSIPAGDLMLHFQTYRHFMDNTLIIAVSRSGSTTEIINAINHVKTIMEVPVISVTCVRDSELSKISDVTLEIPWAFDESVCQTRTVSNLYAAGLQLIAYWGGNDKTISDMEVILKQGNNYMKNYEEKLKEIAEMDWNNAVVLADGELQGIAMVGALAFKEIAQVPSNYYHVLDSRHGPMVMIGQDTLVIACLTSNEYYYQASLIRDIIKKGAKVVVYTDTHVEDIEGIKLHVFFGVSLDHAVRGIPFINISQIIAYYKAKQKGVNPDSPDGLDAWIKL